MSNVLFLASTPLHSLWALGIAAGAFGSDRCALVVIDQRSEERDFIAEALAAKMSAPFVETRRYEQVGKQPLRKLAHARARMREISDYTRRFGPDYVATGNDRRAEFHAALAAAPRAIGAYFDDGTASYSPLASKTVAQSAMVRAVANRVRSLMYGVPTEREPHLGVSRAVREAWVVLPDRVHPGLRAKPIRPIRPEWFQLPMVQAICADATLRAGLDGRVLGGIQLLLALPHDSLMREQPVIRERLQQIADRTLAEGGTVAIKRHPRSRELALDLPAQRVFELPQRLPLEILAPLLNGTEVIGMLTSALIYLRFLGANVRVATLVPPGFAGNPIVDIYHSVGVELLS
ncbi:MAG TPA: polysialyltransferase family glycosyltransferase [Solimonas sp.]|nr:polysialyltransferase family glycosyltransferase [Solimonas sp.]